MLRRTLFRALLVLPGLTLAPLAQAEPVAHNILFKGPLTQDRLWAAFKSVLDRKVKVHTLEISTSRWLEMLGDEDNWSCGGGDVFDTSKPQHFWGANVTFRERKSIVLTNDDGTFLRLVPADPQA